MVTSLPARSVALALLVALWIEILVRAFGLLFLLNFSIEGPNSTAALTILLASGFLLLWRRPPRLPGHALHRRLVVVGALGAMASWWPTPRPALAGALVFLAASLPLARSWAASLGPATAVAAAGGTLLHQGLRAALDGAHVYGTATGISLLAVLVVVWVFVAWHLGPTGASRPGARDEAGQTGGAAPLSVFVWSQAVFVGSTHTVAAWAGAEPIALAVFGGIGLWAGARWGSRVSPLTAGLAVLAGTVDLLWLPAAGVGAFLVQAGLAACLRRCSGLAWDLRRDAIFTGGAQLTIAILVFLHVAAVNWAFVGFVPEPLIRGQSAIYLLLATMALPLFTAAVGQNGRGPTGRRAGAPA